MMHSLSTVAPNPEQGIIFVLMHAQSSCVPQSYPKEKSQGLTGLIANAG